LFAKDELKVIVSFGFQEINVFCPCKNSSKKMKKGRSVVYMFQREKKYKQKITHNTIPQNITQIKKLAKNTYNKKI
jgi:hypothetical protein